MAKSVIEDLFVYLKCAAGSLGPVHGDVGASEQLGAVIAVARGERDSDAHAYVQARHRQHERVLDLGRQPLGDDGGVVRVGVGEQDAEFVTAEASQYVSIPEHALQTRPQHLQYLVTYGMPEGVVDLLEMVEVQQQQGEVTGVIGPCRSAREELVEHAQQMTAVAEACQLVAERLQPVGLGQDPQIVKREHESCPSR